MKQFQQSGQKQDRQEIPMAKRLLTADLVRHEFPSTSWIKVAPTQIRAITADDVQRLGPSFRDLEGREHQVEIGRYLCTGILGEQWTCSHIKDRVVVSPPDKLGNRLYVQREPKPVDCFDVPLPFLLQVGEKTWESQEQGGIITWNGCAFPHLDMRLIERTAFQATYTPYDERMTLLTVPVPPQLEECCGYCGEGRWVALYWGAGDESYVDDGRVMTVGEWDGFLTYVRHPSVSPALHGFHLGSSEEEAKHWLVLDRRHRRIWVAEEQDAENLLRKQWGIPSQEPVLVVEKEEWDRLVQEISSRIQRVSGQDPFPIIMEHQRRVQEMSLWLSQVSDQKPSVGNDAL